MKSRALSTVVLWAVVLAAVGLGGPWGGLALLIVLALLAQHELHGILKICGFGPWRAAPLALGAALILLAGVGGADAETFAKMGLLAAGTLALGALPAATRPEALPRLLGSAFAVAYVPGMLLFYALLMNFVGGTDGLGAAVWVIAVAKFCDMGGYLVGTRIGRVKLAPRISPGKTWEGVAGGLMFSALIGALAALLARGWLPDWLTPVRAAVLALPIAAASVVSDLTESALKRRAGLKDSGGAIPGIGGALDLADSLLLPGPVAFCLFVLFGN